MARMAAQELGGGRNTLVRGKVARAWEGLASVLWDLTVLARLWNPFLLTKPQSVLRPLGPDPRSELPYQVLDPQFLDLTHSTAVPARTLAALVRDPVLLPLPAEKAGSTVQQQRL